jgi:hypothetical protein
MGAEGNLRWPYQAVVMNRFEPTRSRIGSTAGDSRRGMIFRSGSGGICD